MKLDPRPASGRQDVVEQLVERDDRPARDSIGLSNRRRVVANEIDRPHDIVERHGRKPLRPRADYGK
jgi:hypothetical protein